MLTKSGNYGWPYCIRDNTAYNDFDFATRTSGAKFDCAAPVNNSPNNTGRTNLPPAIGASGWMGYSETDSRLPGLGTGGAPMGGPRYHFDANLVSPRKFPAFYDNKWFIGEWNNGWIKTADLSSTGAMTAVQNFALGTGYKRPMDIDFGPDGALYVIEWGSGFNGDNADSGVYRIDYISGEKAPTAQAAGTPTAGLAPLTVQFSSAGSSDPENTTLTYAWDFDSNGTVDSTAANPTLHLHHQRRLHGQADGQGRRGPDRRGQRADHGRQPRAPDHDRVPGGRPVRLLHRHHPLQDHRHRSRGRDHGRGHLLQRRQGHGLARP